MSQVKWILYALAIVLLAAIAGATYVGVSANRYLNERLDIDGEGVSFQIRPGASFTAISNQLADLAIIERPDIFRWYARLTGRADAVHAGEYWIEAGTTPAGLLDKFVRGDVMLHSFTIIEGWNFRELVQALERHPAIISSVTAEDWPAILESFAADAGHPEGLFLPETYRFPLHTRDVDVLRQAYDLMQETLTEEWGARAVNLPIDDPYDALILASIVEKETARADERARIAGVFTRRLEHGMRLQTDPTVIYGIGADFDGNLTRSDLQTDTPYNTYTRSGLPPTPIAMPGRAAIHAALHPAAGPELYFVATGLGDGSHKFSETKEQHDKAVREYLARQRSARAADRGK